MLDELLELTPAEVLLPELVLNPTVLSVDGLEDDVLADEELVVTDTLVVVLVTELVLNPTVLVELVLCCAVQELELVETLLDDGDDDVELVLNAAVLVLLVLELLPVLVLNAAVLLLVSSIDSTTGANPCG